MKRIITLSIVFLFAAATGFSQKIIDKEIEIDVQEATIKFQFADNIIVEAWDKNYLDLHVEVNIDDNKYNEHYSLSIDKSNKEIELIEEIDFEKIKELKGSHKNCNFITDLYYTLKVPKDLKIDLETISGEVELIGCQGQMTINSVSGFIDYSIPQSHKAKIELSTVTGDVYSNINFDKKEAKKISWVGTKEQLSLNGGDVAVNLKTVSGDIYLREH